MLERAGVKSTFIDGLRVTDEATMEVAEMVLSGAINKEIANWITQAGATADVRGVGLSGKDAGLITVETDRTQALIGFIKANHKVLKNLGADITNNFATIVLASMDDKPLARSDHPPSAASNS